MSGAEAVAGDGRYRVLAIDDSAEVITAIRTTLSDGFQVLAAVDGAKGLQIAATRQPDLVLLDVLMPDIDGYEVCRRLKADPATCDIPVIFVTGLDSHGDELRGFELGAVDFVTKPIEPVILRARVIAHAELARTRRQLREANRHLANERELIADIITSMRRVHQFCDRNLAWRSHFAGEASGDLVFSACRPDGIQHVLLGDFTGHGLPAAIGTPLLSHLFYSMTDAGCPLPEILVEINDVLVRQLPVNIFMAAVAMSIGQTDGAVCVWNFGAPDVMHRDAHGSWHALGSQEMPMGIVPHQGDYQYRCLPLPVGESLYLMSDGAYETVCQDGTMYGMERLIASIDREREDVDKVIDELLQQASGKHELDDITLLRVARAE